MLSINEKTCCFTGHRTKDLPKDIMALKQKLYNAIENLIARGVTTFIAGGAVGFDTLAALSVLDIRRSNRDVKLLLYLPCKGQEARWSEDDKKTYHYILSQADEVIYLSEGYFTGCMQKRNRAMVDNSDCCIAYLDKKEGGTYYTVCYANQKGKTVINLAKECLP